MLVVGQGNTPPKAVHAPPPSTRGVWPAVTKGPLGVSELRAVRRTESWAPGVGPGSLQGSQEVKDRVVRQQPEGWGKEHRQAHGASRSGNGRNRPAPGPAAGSSLPHLILAQSSRVQTWGLQAVRCDSADCGAFSGSHGTQTGVPLLTCRSQDGETVGAAWPSSSPPAAIHPCLVNPSVCP